MDVEEARRWLLGERSTTNYIPRDPHETWEVRIAQADAAMMQQAYYILKAHELRDERRFKAACAAPWSDQLFNEFIKHARGDVDEMAKQVVKWPQIYADALLARLDAEKEQSNGR